MDLRVAMAVTADKGLPEAAAGVLVLVVSAAQLFGKFMALEVLYYLPTFRNTKYLGAAAVLVAWAAALPTWAVMALMGAMPLMEFWIFKIIN
jgi:hypothetical protein